MTGKDLRKLSRLELLELMVEQGKEIETLRGQLEEANEEIHSMDSWLEDVQGKLTETNKQLAQKNGQLSSTTAQLKATTEKLEVTQSQLVTTTKQLNETKARLQESQSQLQNSKEEYEKQQIFISEAGSIAEAALKVNGVFEVAQNAAQQYLESVELMKQRQEDICAQMEKESREKAQRLLVKAKQRCAAMERETQVKCKLKEEATVKKCNATLKAAREKIENYYYELNRRQEAGSGAAKKSGEEGAN